MSDKINEQISAMFDDELNAEEYELLIRRLKQDEQLQSNWQRYQLISDVLKKEKITSPGQNFVGAVSQQIDNESAIELADTPSQSKPISWLKPLTGVAIAASVAAMAIVGIQNINPGYAPADPVPALAQSPVQQSIQPVAGTRWDLQQPETEMRLNGYLVNHSEYTSGISLQGMVNYARIAGYDSVRQPAEDNQ
jgi:sigma-E factor negative regulatory protein RseA